MTNQEAIETIKANYPPENYSMLREALDIALALLKEQEARRDYEASVEMAEYCERYEQTYNPEDGSM